MPDRSAPWLAGAALVVMSAASCKAASEPAPPRAEEPALLPASRAVPSPTEASSSDAASEPTPRTSPFPHRIALSELPEGGLFARVPQFSSAPPKLSKRSRLPGLFVGNTPRSMQGRRSAPNPRIFSTPEAARRFEKTGDSHDPTSEVCFTWVREVDAPDLADGGWPSTAFTSALVPIRHSWGGRIAAIHAERLRESDGSTMTLESTDVWLDVTTKGMAHITDSTINLARISVAPDGVELYTARDADLVHVFVRLKNHSDSLLFINDNGELGVTDCGYSRSSFRIPTTTTPVQDSVTIMTACNDEPSWVKQAWVILRIERTGNGETSLVIDDPHTECPAKD